MSYLSDLLGDQYKEDMTLEEVSSLLEAKSDGKDGEISRLKTALSKANGEAAKYKKEMREKMSEDEAKQAEITELINTLTEENKQLKTKELLTDTTAQFIAAGYDATLAADAAKAMVGGNISDVIKAQRQFLDTKKKEIEAEAQRGTPRPKGGEEPGGTPDVGKMSYEQLAEYLENNPDVKLE